MTDRGLTIPIALTSLGIAGISGVSLHVLLTHGTSLAARGPLFEGVLPVLGGIAVGAAVGMGMVLFGRNRDDGQVGTCSACGAMLRGEWRLCPECGLMLEGADAP